MQSMRRNANPYELLTSEEIIEEFSNTSRRYAWSTKKLTTVWRSGGIDAEWDNTIKRHVFTRHSIVEYIKHIRRRLQFDIDILGEDLSPTGT